MASATASVNLYEAMFLLSAKMSADLPAALEFLKGVLARAEAEVLVLRKWEERKLAYPIRGQKRGVYVLAYFRCRGTQVANIERDCNLSEEVTRTLIIAADYMGETELELAKKEVTLAVEAKVRGGEDRPHAAAKESVPAAAKEGLPAAAAGEPAAAGAQAEPAAEPEAQTPPAEKA
jgi:small subunit ribosomal protein S6